ncbi:unnamed protein product [Amoebophrya sp. A25]|nr:unnamed protein product [Amoebophrya sp. A25]|eukprot:GSA25T00025990001.1
MYAGQGDGAGGGVRICKESRGSARDRKGGAFGSARNREGNAETGFWSISKKKSKAATTVQDRPRSDFWNKLAAPVAVMKKACG